MDASKELIIFHKHHHGLRRLPGEGRPNLRHSLHLDDVASGSPANDRPFKEQHQRRSGGILSECLGPVHGRLGCSSQAYSYILFFRSRLTRLKDETNLEFCRAITKRDLGMKDESQIHSLHTYLVKLWAWKKVEEYQSTTNWGVKFLATLNYIQGVWVAHRDVRTEHRGPKGNDTRGREKRQEQQTASTDRLTETDSRGVSQAAPKHSKEEKQGTSHAERAVTPAEARGPETVLNLERNKLAT